MRGRISGLADKEPRIAATEFLFVIAIVAAACARVGVATSKEREIPMTEPNDKQKQEAREVSGFSLPLRLTSQEGNSMSKDYDGFRSGMLRAAEMARSEFKRAPEAAKGHDCVYMSGYEDACDHLSVAIAQAAVIDGVRIAGSQPDWQYHIALLLPDEGIEDDVLLKVYQVVEHELRQAACNKPQPTKEVTT